MESKFNNVTVICNEPHEIVPGECALCQRDSAMRDATRYRTLRAMVGVLNIEIGRIVGVPDHEFTASSPEQIKQWLDHELDVKATEQES